jgi:hypothetical protein
MSRSGSTELAVSLFKSTRIYSGSVAQQIRSVYGVLIWLGIGEVFESKSASMILGREVS